MGPAALRPSAALKTLAFGSVALWCLIAAFPIFWITVMSLKHPVDAFASNPLIVIFGDRTRETGLGISTFGLAVTAAALFSAYRIGRGALPRCASALSRAVGTRVAWILLSAAYILITPIVAIVAIPALAGSLDPLLGIFGRPIVGLTADHYVSVWVEGEFYRNFINSMTVTSGVVLISLTFGTLAGFGLARTRAKIAFWILIAALVFRALPHSVLVTGYLPVFINSAEILRPLFGEGAPTLYGKPLPVIMVLVAINQPFTIWMLRSFFANIPRELDEAARVDGCTYFQAFRYVIIPVMWPGVITTGLFSFLVGYNDYLVTSLLLDEQNQTMVPAITGYFNRETTSTDQVRAVAAAVSITAPLFFLVMVFQRHIVRGLTTGAVKG
ncbi:MAG: carbohydrate ABC transporter permease [Albidovulum sp.]|nr:carbohydrate ABC transporter permease [Albidovulum sp.]